MSSPDREGCSCPKALLYITDDVLRATDDGKSTVLELLDYGQAFDTHDYILLITILWSYYYLRDNWFLLLNI